MDPSPTRPIPERFTDEVIFERVEPLSTNAATSSNRWFDALLVVIGSLMILAVSGYQFGRGNHTVYLLDALRLNDPTLFSRDWFVTGTLQYHAVFSHVTAWLLHAGFIRPAFLVGYLALIVLWSFTWFRLTLALGGSRVSFLFSIVLYELSGAGIALGVYQFLQDGCFVPSNVSNVAMLVGFYCWIVNRRASAGFWLGLAGLFHLNYAVVAVGAWCALSAWRWWDARRGKLVGRAFDRSWWIGAAVALLPSLFNVGIALKVKLEEGNAAMPMAEFVRVYVQFRHDHHFDPLHYPIALWLAFLWPLPIAVLVWRHWRRDAPDAQRTLYDEAAKVFVLMLGLQVVAFCFAGVVFISEALVQLMLWRFSIYVKLMSCIAVAWLVCDSTTLSRRVRSIILSVVPIGIVIALGTLLFLANRAAKSADVQSGPLLVVFNSVRNHWPGILMFGMLSVLPGVSQISLSRVRGIMQRRAWPSVATMVLVGVLVIAGWPACFGWGMTPELVNQNDLALYDWCRQHTPRDAIFLVPPADTAFRLEAQRGIVVNYKHVPQLSAELLEWQKRLKDVLGVEDLTQFPLDYVKAMQALNRSYETRPPKELIEVARRWNADFVVVDHSWGEAFEPARAYGASDGHYFVYAVPAK